MSSLQSQHTETTGYDEMGKMTQRYSQAIDQKNESENCTRTLDEEMFRQEIGQGDGSMILYNVWLA